MCMTYYTVDDLRPGRPGWDVRQFSALAEAIDHYRTLPMDGTRVLGMMDDAHAYELIRCVRLFPGDAQGEDVLAGPIALGFDALAVEHIADRGDGVRADLVGLANEVRSRPQV